MTTATEIPTDLKAFEALARSRPPISHVPANKYEFSGPDIEVSYPPRGQNRFLVRTLISGTPDAVLGEVSHRLGRDTTVHSYEHMAVRVASVEIEDAGWIRVLLVKNLYAGD